MVNPHGSSSSEFKPPERSPRSSALGWLRFAAGALLALSLLVGIGYVLLNIGGPGGSLIHFPPESIPASEPYELTFTLTHQLGKEWERYTDVECYYRVGNEEYTAAPTSLVEKRWNRVVYRAALPPLQKGSSVEYYLTFLLSETRTRDDFGPILVK